MSRKKRCSLEAGALNESIHQVHVLDCLAGGTFDDVVYGGSDNNTASSLIKADADVTEVTASNMLSRWYASFWT